MNIVDIFLFLIKSIPNVIYGISEIIAIIISIILFFIMLGTFGLNSVSDIGTAIGGGCIMSIAAALLFSAPLFYLQKGDNGFIIPYWIIFWFLFILENLFGWIIMIKIILNKNSGNKIQNILFDIIYIFIMAFIVAAWNGKTINDMIFIYKTVKMEIILKIFLEIGGVIYFIVYSIFPIIIYQWIFTKKRKRERKKIVS